MSGTVIIAGSLAQRPLHGGHAWVFLQYLLGLRKLGWQVLFLDEIQDGMGMDDAGRPCPVADSLNVRRFVEIMRAFGLGRAFALNGAGHWIGHDRASVLRAARESAFLLNVMGFLRDEEILAAASRRVFLDIDPGFGQMWHALGLSDIFAGHDDFVTIGENVGCADCNVPTCGLKWITTKQPVVLEEWPVQTTPGLGFTSVASWRGPFGPIEYKGKAYGLRVHEFRKFMELPQRAGGVPFEIAMDIHAAEVRDLDALRRNGWSLREPTTVAGDPSDYRRYVQGSLAEFMVAKNLYVETRGGWFSDRSICYLASGRPVLAQRTGWSMPEGCGLLGFSTLDEAVAGVAEITRNYPAHVLAARHLAEEYFDSDKVLGRLLRSLNLA